MSLLGNDVESNITSSLEETATKVSTESQAKWIHSIFNNDRMTILQVLMNASKDDRRYWVNFELPITGSTVLHHLAQTVDLDMITKIMNWKCGADFSKKNQLGETPLHLLAAAKGFQAIRKQMLAKLLLECTVSQLNPLTRDIWGRRAVDLLPLHERRHLCRTFLGLGEDDTVIFAVPVDDDIDENALQMSAEMKGSKREKFRRKISEMGSVKATNKTSGNSRKISELFPQKSSQYKKQKAKLDSVLEPQPLYYTECQILPMNRSARCQFVDPTVLQHPDLDINTPDTDSDYFKISTSHEFSDSFKKSQLAAASSQNEMKAGKESNADKIMRSFKNMMN
ncbi:uncharacterized protein LOC142342184 [Convolutriloba macropyga]|uniref:uncharacterized protein LOC142342184 n=1 Tax=Convolutriloba macropyga TaxID=536237 RepID=UPI003F51E842